MHSAPVLSHINDSSSLSDPMTENADFPIYKADGKEDGQQGDAEKSGKAAAMQG